MMEVKYNTWPLPNLKQVDAQHFWHDASIWGVKGPSIYLGHKKDEAGWFTAMVFVTDRNQLLGGGYLVKHYYSSGLKQDQQEFFTFQECDHQFEHKSGGNYYHIYTCKKCQARYKVDISD